MALRIVAITMVALALSSCACESTWFRSCGPDREGWGVEQSIHGGQMVVIIERLPPGQYEITARRNWQGREQVLSRGTIAVSRRPSTRVEVTLEPLTGGPMPREAFVVVRRLDRPDA